MCVYIYIYIYISSTIIKSVAGTHAEARAGEAARVALRPDTSATRGMHFHGFRNCRMLMFVQMFNNVHRFSRIVILSHGCSRFSELFLKESIYVYICIYVYTLGIHIYIYIYIYTHRERNMYNTMYEFMYTIQDLRIYIYICIHIIHILYIYIYIYIGIHIHISIFACFIQAVTRTHHVIISPGCHQEKLFYRWGIMRNS